MTPKEFCYWLQGYTELNPNSTPDDSQWKMIQEHLKLVFTKVTPELGEDTIDKQDLMDLVREDMDKWKREWPWDDPFTRHPYQVGDLPKSIEVIYC